MLDTNICSYVLKARPATIKKKFDSIAPGELAISSVVLAELYYGAARHPAGARIRAEIDDFARRLLVVPWDLAAADAYGGLRARLEKKGTLIGAMDMMIAAHALALGAVLVSNNTREFKRVPGLKIDNWA